MEFTVIGTSFNDSKIVINYFESIAKQTIQPVEYILVDGGSKDNTVELVKKYQEKSGLPIKIISGERLNIAQGYNKGIKSAKTGVIIITGLGNKYDTDFFEQLLKFYQDNSVDVVYGPIIGQNNNFFSNIYNKAYLRGKQGWRSWVPSNRGVLINKKVFDSLGYFYEGFVYAGEDSEFFKRVMASEFKVGYAEKARLYWETPKSMKEHIKKKNAYYIGGIQHSGHKKDIAIAIAMLLCIIVSIVFCLTPWPYLAILGVYVALGVRIHTFNPLAIALRVFDMLLPLYLGIKNFKYVKGEYKVRDDHESV